jgi:putative thioredoxin
MSTTPSAWVRDVTEADFEREVVQASWKRPVVVDFWAPWCQPCLMLGPILEKVVNERRGDVVLAKVNIDEQAGLAGPFGVSAIPAVKVFRNGRIVREFTGVQPEPALRALLDSVAPSAADREAEQARGLEATQPAEAERLYREAIAQEPGNEMARLGLARVLLAQGKPDEVEQVLEPVGTDGEVGAEASRLSAQAYLRQVARPFGDEAAARQRLKARPEDAAARYELGCVLAARGDYPAALEMLLSAAERDPKLAASKVREAMVKVFYALGADHPLSNDYRARLSRLLY